MPPLFFEILLSEMLRRGTGIGEGKGGFPTPTAKRERRKLSQWGRERSSSPNGFQCFPSDAECLSSDVANIATVYVVLRLLSLGGAASLLPS